MLPEKKIEKYLRNAKIVSLLSDNKKTRVGCVVVYKNKIISMGHNYENKTSPFGGINYFSNYGDFGFNYF